MTIRRRSLLASLPALALPLPSLSWGQSSLLPINTPGIDHLDVMVPDVVATSQFYMGLFRAALYAQPYRGDYRYFLLLNELGENREVGYLAIGDSRGRGSYIGHFCTTVVDWREHSEAIFSEMTRQFADAGFGEFPGSTGFGGLFTDPDGIEIQFLPAPDTLVTAAEPSELLPWHQGLVTPHGVDHVVLHVSDLERALAWYSLLYGDYGWDEDRHQATFHFPDSDTRLHLQEVDYRYGQSIQIARFGIKVSAFDAAAVRAQIEALGGRVLTVDALPSDRLRLVDTDGNVLELVTVQ